MRTTSTTATWRRNIWGWTSLLALALGGCSLLVDAGAYGSGTADGGTADGGTADGGTADGGIACGCPSGQVMTPSGHCIDRPVCPGGCPEGTVCDYIVPLCMGFPACPPPEDRPPGTTCNDYGLVPMCECPDERFFDPYYPDGPTCLGCTPDLDHWSDVAQMCLPGSRRCDDAPCPLPNMQCVEFIPGDGNWCVEREPCACDMNQICLGSDGICIANGSCEGPPPTSCSITDGADSSELLPMRVLAVEPSSFSPPAKLHIAEALGEPGWTMFWRKSNGTIDAAFAVARADSPECRVAGVHTEAIALCDGSDTLKADLLDVRTLYDGTAQTVIATGLGRRAVMRHLTNPSGTLCADGTQILSYSPTDAGVLALSILPDSPRLDVLIGLIGTSSAYQVSRRSPTITVTVDFPSSAEPNGEIAANWSFTAIPAGSQVYFWDGRTDSFRHPSTDALAPGLVAAVGPRPVSNTSYFFALEEDTGEVKSFWCTRDSGCSGDDPGISLVSGNPIAAYLDPDITVNPANLRLRLIGVEGGPDDLRLTRFRETERGSTERQVVLDGGMVGGRITAVHALDAEVVRNMEGAIPMQRGWLHVWAAFVTVQRSWGEALELWTGGVRQCSP